MNEFIHVAAVTYSNQNIIRKVQKYYGRYQIYFPAYLTNPSYDNSFTLFLVYRYFPSMLMGTCKVGGINRGT